DSEHACRLVAQPLCALGFRGRQARKKRGGLVKALPRLLHILVARLGHRQEQERDSVLAGLELVGLFERNEGRLPLAGPILCRPERAPRVHVLRGLLDGALCQLQRAGRVVTTGFWTGDEHPGQRVQGNGDVVDVTASGGQVLLGVGQVRRDQGRPFLRRELFVFLRQTDAPGQRGGGGQEVLPLRRLHP